MSGKPTDKDSKKEKVKSGDEDGDHSVREVVPQLQEDSVIARSQREAMRPAARVEILDDEFIQISMNSIIKAYRAPTPPPDTRPLYARLTKDKYYFFREDASKKIIDKWFHPFSLVIDWDAVKKDWFAVSHVQETSVEAVEMFARGDFSATPGEVCQWLAWEALVNAVEVNKAFVSSRVPHVALMANREVELDLHETEEVVAGSCPADKPIVDAIQTVYNVLNHYYKFSRAYSSEKSSFRAHFFKSGVLYYLNEMHKAIQNSNFYDAKKYLQILDVLLQYVLSLEIFTEKYHTYEFAKIIEIKKNLSSALESIEAEIQKENIPYRLRAIVEKVNRVFVGVQNLIIQTFSDSVSNEQDIDLSVIVGVERCFNYGDIYRLDKQRGMYERSSRCALSGFMTFEQIQSTLRAMNDLPLEDEIKTKFSINKDRAKFFDFDSEPALKKMFLSSPGALLCEVFRPIEHLREIERQFGQLGVTDRIRLIRAYLSHNPFLITKERSYLLDGLIGMLVKFYSYFFSKSSISYTQGMVYRVAKAHANLLLDVCSDMRQQFCFQLLLNELITLSDTLGSFAIMGWMRNLLLDYLHFTASGLLHMQDLINQMTIVLTAYQSGDNHKILTGSAQALPGLFLISNKYLPLVNDLTVRIQRYLRALKDLSYVCQSFDVKQLMSLLKQAETVRQELVQGYTAFHSIMSRDVGKCLEAKKELPRDREFQGPTGLLESSGKKALLLDLFPVDDTPDEYKDTEGLFDRYRSACVVTRLSVRDFRKEQQVDWINSTEFAWVKEDSDSGNCLFIAIAKQCDGLSYQEVRQLAVKHMSVRPYRDSYESSIIKEGADIVLAFGDHHRRFDLKVKPGENIVDFDSYLQTMGLNLVWGGHLEVLALSEALDRPIVVLTIGDQISPQFYNRHSVKTPIFLYYDGVKFLALSLTEQFQQQKEERLREFYDQLLAEYDAGNIAQTRYTDVSKDIDFFAERQQVVEALEGKFDQLLLGRWYHVIFEGKKKLLDLKAEVFERLKEYFGHDAVNTYCFADLAGQLLNKGHTIIEVTGLRMIEITLDEIGWTILEEFEQRLHALISEAEHKKDYYSNQRLLMLLSPYRERSLPILGEWPKDGEPLLPRHLIALFGFTDCHSVDFLLDKTHDLLLKKSRSLKIQSSVGMFAVSTASLSSEPSDKKTPSDKSSDTKVSEKSSLSKKNLRFALEENSAIQLVSTWCNIAMSDLSLNLMTKGVEQLSQLHYLKSDFYHDSVQFYTEAHFDIALTFVTKLTTTWDFKKTFTGLFAPDSKSGPSRQARVAGVFRLHLAFCQFVNILRCQSVLLSDVDTAVTLPKAEDMFYTLTMQISHYVKEVSCFTESQTCRQLLQLERGIQPKDHGVLLQFLGHFIQINPYSICSDYLRYLEEVVEQGAKKTETEADSVNAIAEVLAEYFKANRVESKKDVARTFPSLDNK